MAATPKYAAAHVDPRGPGDARPTAAEILHDEDMVGNLCGKVILITGCSSGLGIETARALLATGAHVFVTARDTVKGQEVVRDLTESTSASGRISLLSLDLNSLESVRACAKEFLQRSNQLNILITNAGVMACPESKTKEGFETQFGVNHLAHFLLFQLLQPTLLASATSIFNSRVVSLTSSNHRMSRIQFDDLDFTKAGYNPWVAYGQAKTANIYFANEVERRFRSGGLHATSVHPGGIMTGLGRHLDAEVIKGMMTPGMEKAMKSPEQGAATTVWAAIGKQWEGCGGKYLEDCSISKPFQEGDASPLAPGYAPHAYDVEAARQLWDVSVKLVGRE